MIRPAPQSSLPGIELESLTPRRTNVELAGSRIIVGDARRVLQSIPSNFFQCCVTSPPYWGLRDYGIEEQIGAEDDLSSYIDKLCTVFDEVYRALRPDGRTGCTAG